MTHTVETGRLLAPKEVAHRLRCSPITVYRAIERGDLEAVRLGEHGSLRVSEDALERFLRPARALREHLREPTEADNA